MEDTNKETNTGEKEEISLSLNNRDKFESQFESVHEQDSKESEEVSEAPAVKEGQSDSSSVKEEVKGGEPKEEIVDKTTELLKNKEKALHEEREKRKQANLKLRELQERMKEFEKRLADATPKASSDVQSETEDSETKTDKLRLKELEERVQKDAMQKEQEQATEKRKKLDESILQTDKALKDDGFPGFRIAINEVDKVLKQMFAEGEIEESDYLDPIQWKEVYKTKIYPEVASEFAPAQQEKTLKARMDKKKEAAKVPSAGGSKPEAKVEATEDEPDTDDVKDYLKFRKKNSARV